MDIVWDNKNKISYHKSKINGKRKALDESINKVLEEYEKAQNNKRAKSDKEHQQLE